MGGDAQVPFWRGLWLEPVALGLGLLIILRPWRDGVTFPGFNAYFYAIALAVGSIWCAWGLLRPRPVQSLVAVALLTAFAAVAWVTSFASYAYDPTHRGLQRLAICLLVFVMASNGLRTRRAVGIVLGAILIGWTLNSLWTIFHYNVMLRGMRQVLRDNPLVLQEYFGVTELTPELKHRIEANRAFGTFLFPNALGAFLVLGIPIFAAALPDAMRALRAARVRGSGDSTKQWVITAFGVGVTAATLAVLYFGNAFVGLARPGQNAPVQGAYLPFLVFLPAAIVAGAFTVWFVRTRGHAAFGRMCMGLVVVVGFAACVVSLWLSYSRGAMLALGVCGVLIVLLLNARRFGVGARAMRGVAAVLVGISLLTPAGGGAEEKDGYRLPEPTPSALSYYQLKYEQFARESRKLDIEGKARSLESLRDTASIRLRTTYWQVGMRMLADNVWAGVGLGNFLTAYPRYQFLGAGDVEAAHNDFLQSFCETGVFGGGLFLAFWVYFGVWGGRQLLRETDRERRRWLAATYAGGLAFAVHSLVDFNFQNASLSMPAFAIAGLFFAVSHLDTRDADSLPNGRTITRIAAALMMVVVVVTTASVLRVYLFDLGLTERRGLVRLYTIGDRKPMLGKLEAAAEMWRQLKRTDQRPAVHLLGALRVIPDMAKLAEIGELWVTLPEQPSMARRLKPGEAPPSNTYLLIVNVPAAKQAVMAACERRVEVLREWDASYPHDPEFAAHIFSWYDLMYTNPIDPGARRRHALEAEIWSRKAVDRSPNVAWWWLNYAKALWMRGGIEPGPLGVDYYRTGLGYYKKAHELYPTSGVLASHYGQALQKLGEALIKQGVVADGNAMVAEAQQMGERAMVLDKYLQLVH